MPALLTTHHVNTLALDDENPRLPESLQRKTQTEILEWLVRNAALEELAQSFVDNGFFEHEPLIVIPTAGQRYVVLEGNRRVAALMILHGLPAAGEFEFVGISATKRQRELLTNVPCYQIEDREQVHLFLGFRHIGGIKTWSAEAKARYLAAEIDKAVKANSSDPFRQVARQVGSNALGVRNPYIALKILESGRDEFGIDSTYVQLERFGVWLRCMNSQEIRDFIGFGTARTIDEIESSLGALKKQPLKEVLDDLTPQPGHHQALLADSRNVTDYGRVLANKKAHAVLRKHRDLTIAKQVIDELDLPQRIQRITAALKLVLDDLQLAERNQDIETAVEGLYGVARAIRSVVKDKNEDD